MSTLKIKKKDKTLLEKVYSEEVFLSDGFAAYRTEPPTKEGRSFRLFVKVRDGEKELKPSANHFNKMLSGEEIREEISPEGYYRFVHRQINF